MSYENILVVMKERSRCRNLGRVMLRKNEVQEEEETLDGCARAEAHLPSLVSKHFPLPPKDLLSLTCLC
jgi:PleD family two-component response regulator